MFDRLISFSLQRRLLVASLAALVTAWGAWEALRMPVDVFPDLNRPTVTVLTEAHGMTPEQVESQVTRPVESSMTGAPGVLRVRSSSGIGISIVHVEFDWGTDPYRARQVVQEKLNLLRDRLPPGVSPALGPISSIMGEILLLGMTSERLPALARAAEEGAEGSAAGIQDELLRLRDIADWQVRPRLLTIPGVSQAIPMGGEARQYQVLLDPVRLTRQGLTLEDVREAVARSNQSTAGGFVEARGLELQVPILGRASGLEDLAEAVVAVRGGAPVRLRHVADVRIGARVKRGTAAVTWRAAGGEVEAAPAVILTVQKQPGADTLAVTRAVREAIGEIEAGVNRDAASPSPVAIRSDLFLQADFIQRSVDNVLEALRDGGVLVALVLFAFLLNLRTTMISLAAIPLSFVVTALLFKLFGYTINTMTLGGLAVATGQITDDAVVDVENVFRRLRENRARGSPVRPLEVVFQASREIRNSVVLSTFIVLLTFLPVLALSGIEGRLFAPLGVAYMASLLASLVVSLTVTPVLCYWLLPSAPAMERREGPVVRWVQGLTERTLATTLRFPGRIIAVTGALVALCALSVVLLGKDFLPAFNEGTITVEAALRPGTALSETDRVGTAVQRLLHNVPEVASTARRTGRADMDEHAEGVHYSEIDVDLKPSGRSRAAVLADVRRELAKVPSLVTDVGQPISHRIDHMMSGIRSQVAIKVHGDDLEELRAQASRIEEAIRPRRDARGRLVSGVDGLVDLKVEPQVLVPEVKVDVRREDAARFGFRPGDLAEALETAFGGSVVSQVLEGQRSYDLVVWTAPEARRDAEAMASAVLVSPAGPHVALRQIADVYEGFGPNVIQREGGRRRIVVSSNVAGRDLEGAVEDVRTLVTRDVEPGLPAGYQVEYGGQFESQARASRTITLLGALAVLASFLLLYGHFRSAQVSFQILLTIHQCFIGAVLAILLAPQGGWLEPRSANIAHLVGFSSLVGIAARNGVLLIDRYVRLHREEGMPFGPELIVRGSRERVVPMAMTTLTAMLALLPILIAPGAPGKEVLYPVAVVVFGGLASTAVLDIVFTPAVFLRFGRAAVEREGS